MSRSASHAQVRHGWFPKGRNPNCSNLHCKGVFSEYPLISTDKTQLRRGGVEGLLALVLQLWACLFQVAPVTAFAGRLPGVSFDSSGGGFPGARPARSRGPTVGAHLLPGWGIRPLGQWHLIGQAGGAAVAAIGFLTVAAAGIFRGRPPGLTRLGQLRLQPARGAAEPRRADIRLELVRGAVLLGCASSSTTRSGTLTAATHQDGRLWGASPPIRRRPRYCPVRHHGPGCGLARRRRQWPGLGADRAARGGEGRLPAVVAVR